jgi:release factor glutamine methyltransferase
MRKGTRFHVSDPLTEEQSKLIDGEITRNIFATMRDVPKEGRVVYYLGKRFLVHENVFWPQEDSMPLVKNFIVHPGEKVLDLGTGSGVIAIHAAYKGARSVEAVDINPDAVRCAKMNVKLHGFEKLVSVRESNMLENISGGGYDIITGNLPFRKDKSKDVVEKATYSDGLRVYRGLFENAYWCLKNNGRIYLAQANFGEVRGVLDIADKAGFKHGLIGRMRRDPTGDDPRVYYAFEFWRKGR